jgi:hypothetical protein
MRAGSQNPGGIMFTTRPPRRPNSAANSPRCWRVVTMPPPSKVKGRPPVTSRKSAPDADSATITNVRVTQAPAPLPVPASVLPPWGTRSWWWAWYPCPACCGTHMARSQTEDGLTSPRRARCGRQVVLSAADSAEVAISAYEAGWRQGLEAGAERGTAA